MPVLSRAAPPPPRVVLLAGPLVALGMPALLGGCGGSSHSATAPTPVSLPASTAAACSTKPPGEGGAWPAGVPAGFPRFPGQTVNAPTQEGGSTVVQFGLPLELASATEQVRAALLAAGYPLGDLDSEAGKESDTRFAGKGSSGRVKIVRLDSCRSRAILAVKQTGATTAPLGTVVTPGSSSAASATP